MRDNNDSLSTAQDLGSLTQEGTIRFNQNIGYSRSPFGFGRDTLDFLRFTVNNATTVKIFFSTVSKPAEIFLLDRFGNSISGGETNNSYGAGRKTFNQYLASGTYYVKIRSVNNFSTYYGLEIEKQNVTQNPVIHGTFRSDNLMGGDGNDKIYGHGGNDRLHGNLGDDTLYGNSENDFLYGNGGDDELHGGDGSDLLYGGENDDILHGNSGNDELIGGLGADAFYFYQLQDGIDIIKDFNRIEGDKIQINGSGFGASSTSQFSFDFNSKRLSFLGNHFATLENLTYSSDFIPSLDMTIV